MQTKPEVSRNDWNSWWPPRPHPSHLLSAPTLGWACPLQCHRNQCENCKVPQAFSWLRVRPQSKLTFAGLMIARGVLHGWLIMATLVPAVQGVAGLRNIQPRRHVGHVGMDVQHCVHRALFIVHCPIAGKKRCHRAAAHNVSRIA